MDIGTLRGVMTLVLFIAFIGLLGWLIFGTRAKDFESAARLPLDNDEDERRAAASQRRHSSRDTAEQS
jgi:cytochrome c oxidase cbb3-type subunit 4